MIKKYVRKEKLMGCSFELGLYVEDEVFAEKMLEIGVGEIQRIESLLTEFKKESETSRINREAGVNFISIDDECFQLISRSINISRLTKGNFDITVGALKKLYSFKGGEMSFPDIKVIKKALKSVGHQKIVLQEDGNKVRFNNRNLKISFAAIGKGYAADKVQLLWKKEGVQSAFINASGDLSIFGLKPNKEKWKVVIAHPDDRSQSLFSLPLLNCAMATSGDYEQYFHLNGKRYSHTLDPFTGLPLQGVKSVSIISPSAELSDALATACYVMGKEKCMKFVEELPKTHCILIDENNDIFMTSELEYIAVNG